MIVGITEKLFGCGSVGIDSPAVHILDVHVVGLVKRIDICVVPSFEFFIEDPVAVIEPGMVVLLQGPLERVCESLPCSVCDGVGFYFRLFIA